MSEILFYIIENLKIKLPLEKIDHYPLTGFLN